MISITPDATDAGNVEIGTNSEGGSIPIPLDKYLNPTTVALGVVLVSGAATYTVEHTFDDVFDGDASAVRAWFVNDGANLVGASDNQDGNYAFPPTATRLLTTAGTGELRYVVNQAGAVS